MRVPLRWLNQFIDELPPVRLFGFDDEAMEPEFACRIEEAIGSPPVSEPMLERFPRRLPSTF